MFETRFTFDGAFQADSPKDSVTTSLLALVSMILDGANIKHQTQLANISTTPAALTLSQLLVFNSVKHARSAESTSVRHSRERETPFPLYLTLKIHAVTRSRGLIDTLFSLGMCVSYARLLQLIADIANGVCKRFNMEVVCPPKLPQGLSIILRLSIILTVTQDCDGQGFFSWHWYHPNATFITHEWDSRFLHSRQPCYQDPPCTPSHSCNPPHTTQAGIQ